MSGNKIFLTYDVAKEHLQEGDILLFRGKRIFSFFIKRMSRSKYSHVGIASWHNGTNGMWEIIEFRGIRGGRTVSLEQIVKSEPGIIDVYRPGQIEKLTFHPETQIVESVIIPYPQKKVTLKMRELTGPGYGWKRIFLFLLWYIPILRFVYNMDDIVSDKITDIVYPVCSTSIAYSASINKYDFVHNKADNWTQPADIASSNSLSYLFTLTT